jgi:hypothetical protein
MKHFFTFIFLSVALYSFSQNDKPQHLEFVSPANKPVITPDGNHTLYNNNKQKVKEGLFKDGRLYDGCNYSYDKDGSILSISIYRGGRYIGDSTLVDSNAKNKKPKEK